MVNKMKWKTLFFPENVFHAVSRYRLRETLVLLIYINIHTLCKHNFFFQKKNDKNYANKLGPKPSKRRLEKNSSEYHNL